MTHVPSAAPWSERGGRLRALVDIAAGRYPRFLFGFGVGAILPVFHFHETTASELEPAFQYLAENGYRTLVAEEMAAVAYGRQAPARKSVVLAFDDALASLWLVAAPLLRRYSLRAVTYAIPGRTTEAAATRPTLDDGPVDGRAADEGPSPLSTWPELRAMAAGGHVDVQSHTWSHSMMYCGDQVTDVIRPGVIPDRPFNRPRLNASDPPVFLDPSRLGYPLFRRRSRMSDARRFYPDDDDIARVEGFVGDRGGAAFFDAASWRADLAPVLRSIRGRWESDAERVAAIEYELVTAREALATRLGQSVRHVCLPWGVSGTITHDCLRRLGFTTAIANQWRGQFAVRRGDDPFFLKRLPHRHIFALPGAGRRVLRTFV